MAVNSVASVLSPGNSTDRLPKVQSWSQPLVSKLPGIGRDLALFDSATQNVRPTAPGEVAKIYVCGITPYDATHIGHANTYVAFDLLIRTWLDSGVQVDYVQNVTDIDEPLLERAVATGTDWREIADRETALFREDMQALGVIAPAHYIGAVGVDPTGCRTCAGVAGGQEKPTHSRVISISQLRIHPCSGPFRISAMTKC